MNNKKQQCRTNILGYTVMKYLKYLKSTHENCLAYTTKGDPKNPQIEWSI